MRIISKRTLLIAALAAAVLFPACSAYQTYVNLSRLKFQWGGVNNISLAGVNLAGKKSMGDFSAMEILALTTSFARGSMPLRFTLNVEAKNPNDGTGGYPRTNAAITELPYRLLVDGREMLTGGIDAPVDVPGTGETVTIPVAVGFDLIKMFKDKNYESLMNLVLQLSGSEGKAASVELYLQPSVETELGEITYPKEIRVLDKQF